MREAAVVSTPAPAGRARGRSRRGRGRPTANDASRTNSSAPVDPAPTATPAPTNRGRGRRRPFRGQLSGPSTQPQREAAAVQATLTEHSSLQARLTYELMSNTAECSICTDTIAQAQWIHSCSTCSALTHLKCISQWAERSISDAKERARLLAASSNATLAIAWRCPSCQSNFDAAHAPKQYRCFCQRVQNPRVPPKHIVPHSCGQPCSRPRAPGCTHQCPALCHPGPCEPCMVSVKTSCYCGKDEKWFQCAAINSAKADEASQVKSCGQTCGKMLMCGLHVCKAVCHSGECGSCEIVREKICFCGQDTVTEVCSTAGHPSVFRTPCVGPDGQKWTGEFACQQACPWKYDCAIHDCTEQDQACHAHPSSQPLHCPSSPDVVRLCPCGNTPLSIQRTACTDPIPSCNKVCSKAFDCGHVCQEICHTGACPPCQEPVTSVCRCGSEKRVVTCSTLAQEKEDFACHRQCKALRHCGKHPCGRTCCPLSFQESLLGKKNKRTKPSPELAMLEDPSGLHVCPLICGRLLSCGIHNCQANDHRGPCGRCLASEFSEVSCACGGTVLLPPVQCGTRILCDLPCHRPGPACGHPKVPHPCHENEVPCPPCSFLVEKECQCAKKIHVKNVRCSQEKVSCGNVCNRVLSCGAHRCRLVCHKDACESCTQICGKPRRFCAHPHEAPCHAPSACSTAVPCQVMVDASCTCGNDVQRMMCGSSTSKPTSSAVAPLPCTDACAVLKRNAALAEALGIDPDRSTAPQSRPVEYEDETLEFYAANKAFAADIEQSLSDFLKSARQTLLFPPMKPPQRHYVKTVAALWNLSAQSLDAEPNRAVYVSKKSRSPPFQPSNSVGETCKTFLAPRAVQHLSLESKPAKTQWNALSLNAVFGLDESALRALIEPLVQGQAFTLDWLGEEDVLFRLVGVEEPDRQLRNIRTTLLGEKRIMASQGIDGVLVGSDGRVEWREDWSIASASTSKWAASSSAGGVQNRWSALAS